MKKKLYIYSQDEKTHKKLKRIVTEAKADFLNNPDNFIFKRHKTAFKRSEKKKHDKTRLALKSPLKTPPNRFKRRK